MKTEIIVAFISGILGIIAGVAGNSMITNNQTVNLIIDGNPVSISMKDYLSTYSDLDSKYIELQESYNKLDEQYNNLLTLANNSESTNTITSETPNQSPMPIQSSAPVSINWMNICAPYQYNGDHDVYDGKDPTRSFSMSGNEYTEGFVLFVQGRASTSGISEAMFNLNARFKSLDVTIGHIDSTNYANSKMYVYLDGNLNTEIDLNYDDIAKNYHFDLNYALQLKIEIMSGYYGLTNGIWS